MKGFIELTNKDNKKILRETKYVCMYADNVYEDSILGKVEVKETYEEIKQKIQEAE